MPVCLFAVATRKLANGVDFPLVAVSALELRVGSESLEDSRECRESSSRVRVGHSNTKRASCFNAAGFTPNRSVSATCLSRRPIRAANCRLAARPVGSSKPEGAEWARVSADANGACKCRRNALILCSYDCFPPLERANQNKHALTLAALEHDRCAHQNDKSHQFKFGLEHLSHQQVGLHVSRAL